MKDGNKVNNALKAIYMMAGFDGSHHKQYCLDQVLRALLGGEPVPQENGQVYEYTKTEGYEAWLKMYQAGDDGPETYPAWDEGIAP